MRRAYDFLGGTQENYNTLLPIGGNSLLSAWKTMKLIYVSENDCNTLFIEINVDQITIILQRHKSFRIH